MDFLNDMFTDSSNFSMDMSPSLNGGDQAKVDAALQSYLHNNFGKGELNFFEQYAPAAITAVMTGGLGDGLGAGLGGGMWSSGLAGAFGGGFTGGALAGGLGSAALGGDPVKGALTGGALSFAPDVSGYAGVTDPVYSGILNGGVKGAVGGAITGGREGAAGGAITGGIMGGLHGYDVSQAHYSPTDSRQALLNDITQTSYAPNDSGGYQSPTSGRSYALSADSGQSFAPAYTSNGSYNAPEMQAPSESTWASPDLGALMGNILPSSARGWGDLAQGALGMYGAYKQRKMARDLQSQIGGNRKAYQTQLTRDLQRRDAASGRRSNYAGRATELQSSLAQLDSRNAPALAQLQQAELGGLVNMFQTGLRYGNKAGWFGSPDTQQQPAMQPQQPLYLPSLIGQQQGPQDYSVDQQRKIKLGGYGG